MFNPRFPHRLKVLRPVMDNDGIPVYGENGSPEYEVVPLDVVRIVNDYPLTDGEGKFITDRVDEIGFGYRTATQNTSKAGEVINADFKIALPMFTTLVLTGDLLELTDYDRTYQGQVLKKMTSNYGSNIWFNEVKN